MYCLVMRKRIAGGIVVLFSDEEKKRERTADEVNV